jgi:DNA-binding NtrC family response regulator
MKQTAILLLDFDPAGCPGSALRTILESSFCAGDRLRRVCIEDFGHVQAVGHLCKPSADFSPDLIFLILPPDQAPRARALIQDVRVEQPEAAIIVVLEDSDPTEILALLQHGASDFMTPPLKKSDTLARVWRLLEQMSRKESLTQTLKAKIGLKRLVGEAANFLAEIRKIPLVARCDGRVLITGETGTGKELCARAIHYLGQRMDKPFVPVNCGAIPVELVENELFGHERGAFTSATTAQHGLIHEAEGGTLFLDDIDCLPLLTQTKLLRFLQEKEYRPLGSAKSRQADVRVIAASNVNLEEAVKKGRMRQDFYYRLNIVPLTLPPLRERQEDIPLLARHFLSKYTVELGKSVTELSPEAVRKLIFYDWPGNIRELEHTIERAVVLCETEYISAEDILLPVSENVIDDESFRQAKAKVVAQFEKDYIERLLLSHEGNISRAAQSARKNRRAFWQLIRKYHIDAQSFKSSAQTRHSSRTIPGPR